jgi:hypothetical protein
VFFLSLLQPLGATMPIAEAQSHWVADHLKGEYALPLREEMRKDMEAERRKMFDRYLASKRHTMQVDFDDYLYELRRERRRGGDRARAQGYRLPIPGRAGPPAPAAKADPAVAA